MNEPLDELYFRWLYKQISLSSKPKALNSHWNLARQLFKKEFVWLIPNDDNRMEDGRYLRNEFFDDEGIVGVDEQWLSMGCSMLEMLIGLSRRLSFEAEGEPREWFWHLLGNIGLGRITDHMYTPAISDHIDSILDIIIWRTYEPDGAGGLFPLPYTNRDQRQVEIWYQMSEYLAAS